MSTYQHVHTRPAEELDIRECHGIARDVLAIYRELQSASRPLASRELSANIYLGKRQVEHRLDALIVHGHVRRREDGPDGRVSYYEASDRVHHCNGDYWEPKAVSVA